MTNPSENFIEFRSHALLVALHQRALREAFPMTVVTFVIAILAITESPKLHVFIWVFIALIIQAARYQIVPRLNRPGEPGAKKRLDIAVMITLLGALWLALSIIFFEAFDEGTRAIYTMIVIATCIGNIVGSHGYLPTNLAHSGPLFLTLALAWMNFPMNGIADWKQSYIFLFLVLGAFLLNACRDMFRAFEENCVLTEKLQAALESETRANAAKTRFLASASHDLRQPLHTMSMLSAALTLRPLDSESASIAKRISDAMSELSSELDSLLDISKIDAGATHISATQFAVNPLLERLINDYRPAASAKNLEISGIYNATLSIETDRKLFERTLRNLLDNAVKYTDTGSITVTVTEREKMCIIQIKDTGVGIAQADQKRVYEEFYQLHNPERDRKNGLGLGLSIVSRIVILLDAKLELVSTPGIGSTFTLCIPGVLSSCLVDKAHHKKTLPWNKSSSPERGFTGIHTLVVEDNREVRRSIRTLLEGAGSRVSTAASTRDAIEIARQDKPDILLIDIRLPAGDSGYRTISQMRELLPDIPVIIISGEHIPNGAEFADIDNCEYFVKPVDMPTLFSQMQEML